MFALSGDSRPLGENDDVGGVLKRRDGGRAAISPHSSTLMTPRWRGFTNRALLCKKTEQREQILLFFCSFIAMNKRQKIVGFYPLR